MLDAPLIFIDHLENYSSPQHETAGKDFFNIFWLKDETPSSLLKEHPLKVKGDWMYLIPPFRHPSFEKKDKQGMVISFHRQLLDFEVKEYSIDLFKLFSRQGEFSMLYLPEEEVETLEILAEVLLKESQNGESQFLFLKNLLKTFLVKLIFLKEQKFTVPDLNEKRIYQFFVLVENHFLTERKTGFYAEKLNISSKRLNQILKERLNKTISQIIQERLISEAKHQLFLGERSIMEIGIHLGFSDKSYFSRFFKKMTGLTPEGFKKKVKERLVLEKNPIGFEDF